MKVAVFLLTTSQHFLIVSKGLPVSDSISMPINLAIIYNR